MNLKMSTKKDSQAAYSPSSLKMCNLLPVKENNKAYTKKELLCIAKRLDIPKTSTMTKDKLCSVIIDKINKVTDISTLSLPKKLTIHTSPPRTTITLPQVFDAPIKLIGSVEDMIKIGKKFKNTAILSTKHKNVVDILWVITVNVLGTNIQIFNGRDHNKVYELVLTKRFNIIPIMINYNEMILGGIGMKDIRSILLIDTKSHTIEKIDAVGPTIYISKKNLQISQFARTFFDRELEYTNYYNICSYSSEQIVLHDYSSTYTPIRRDSKIDCSLLMLAYLVERLSYPDKMLFSFEYDLIKKYTEPKLKEGIIAHLHSILHQSDGTL